MAARIDPRRVLHESLPIAVVVLLWSSLAWFVGVLGGDPPVTTGLRYAGLAVGALYAVGSGYDLADAFPRGAATGDVSSVVRQSVGVLLPAGVWFGAAWGVGLLADLWGAVGLPGLFYSPAGQLSAALAAAGVFTVLLQVVALGAATVRDPSGGEDGDLDGGGDRPQSVGSGPVGNRSEPAADDD